MTEADSARGATPLEANRRAGAHRRRVGPRPDRHIHYLAYGSNLHPVRLLERVPSARTVGVVELPGQRLAFSKRGRDGSGKCTFERAGRSQLLFGVLYAIDAGHKSTLDAIEGSGVGYTECTLRVTAQTPHGPRQARPYTYQAHPAHVDPGLQPYDWYKALVLAGALHHGMPAGYVAAIEAIESRPDPDPERARRNARLLREIGFW